MIKSEVTEKKDVKKFFPHTSKKFGFPGHRTAGKRFTVATGKPPLPGPPIIFPTVDPVYSALLP